MYALAASAAGVGIVALAQLAEARIVYTRTHQVVGLYGQYDLDLNHDKIVDYILSNNSNCTVNCWQWLSLRPATLAGNAVISARSYVVAMAKGSRIGSGDHFRSVTGVDRMLLDVNGTQIFGSWYDVTNRYAGLKFNINGKTHYGWARMSVSGKAFRTVTATLTGYAYETIPNKAIIAGKTRGRDDNDAAPGTLGKLALGRK